MERHDKQRIAGYRDVLTAIDALTDRLDYLAEHTSGDAKQSASEARAIAYAINDELITLTQRVSQEAIIQIITDYE